MRNHIDRLTVALAVAALGVACVGGTSTVKQTEERTRSVASPRVTVRPGTALPAAIRTPRVRRAS
jgi:hypothetical protein